MNLDPTTAETASRLARVPLAQLEVWDVELPKATRRWQTAFADFDRAMRAHQAILKRRNDAAAWDRFEGEVAAWQATSDALGARCRAWLANPVGRPPLLDEGPPLIAHMADLARSWR